MVKVKFELSLDAENPNDSAAIAEVMKWKVLQEKGKKKTYLAEQKTAFMAGLYLHSIAPQLCNKLAQNLAAANLEDLEYFNQAMFEKGDKELQLEGVLLKLSEIQDLINTTIETGRPLPTDEMPVAQAVTEKVSVETLVEQEIDLSDRLKKIGKIKSNSLF